MMIDERSDFSEVPVLSNVKRHLGAIIGDPQLKFTEIAMGTTFGNDLELESIEFVALADRLRTEFGERVNFVEFLSTKNVDEMISLQVGDLVRYISNCLRSNRVRLEEAGR